MADAIVFLVLYVVICCAYHAVKKYFTILKILLRNKKNL